MFSFCFRLGDLQNLVNQLYEALNVKDHHVQKELHIHTELETLQQEIQPLEDVSIVLPTLFNKTCFNHF